jgi:hypothetical protein
MTATGQRRSTKNRSGPPSNAHSQPGCSRYRKSRSTRTITTLSSPIVSDAACCAVTGSRWSWKKPVKLARKQGLRQWVS